MDEASFIWSKKIGLVLTVCEHWIVVNYSSWIVTFFSMCHRRNLIWNAFYQRQIWTVTYRLNSTGLHLQSALSSTYHQNMGAMYPLQNNNVLKESWRIQESEINYIQTSQVLGIPLANSPNMTTISANMMNDLLKSKQRDHSTEPHEWWQWSITLEHAYTPDRTSKWTCICQT